MAFGTGPDGRLLLAAGSEDKTVRLWEPATGFCVATIHHRSGVDSVAMTVVVLATGDHEELSVIETRAVSDAGCRIGLKQAPEGRLPSRASNRLAAP